ncbi:Sodium/iodide cotransporter [Mizuhopecten yessoensis]|uniref:Sodium/iodide cotransporter n=1 Tax=Mizuhopecten yessoensis TaxID=6573 RepID=A0A210QNN6_MIZYE|nr:Sodium/iodide cotransporter [Mizuhopecten yessoensis]
MAISFVPIPNLHIADYVVMVIFLCICMGIGIYYGYTTSKNPTLENYFFGNRRLLILPVAMSLFVTFTSAISIMGHPAEVYVYGIRVIYGGVPSILSMSIANVTIVPLLFPLKLISTYEVRLSICYSSCYMSVGILSITIMLCWLWRNIRYSSE